MPGQTRTGPEPRFVSLDDLDPLDDDPLDDGRERGWALARQSARRVRRSLRLPSDRPEPRFVSLDDEVDDDDELDDDRRTLDARGIAEHMAVPGFIVLDDYLEDE